MLEQLFQLPKSPPEGLVMAFDFGLKRIGCAIGQMITSTATSLRVILATQGEPHWDEVKALVQHWDPVLLVVGIPLKVDGSIQPITESTFIFCQQLKKHLALPVYGVDECLTSVAAENIIKTNERKIMRKQSVDSMSAKIILENWFDRVSAQGVIAHGGT